MAGYLQGDPIVTIARVFVNFDPVVSLGLT